MMNIFQTILVLVIFLTVKYGVWKITSEDKVPEFLNYQPYNCPKCAGFWFLTALFVACGLLLGLWITMAVGMLITVLDTIAMVMHERKNTITLEEFDRLNK